MEAYTYSIKTKALSIFYVSDIHRGNANHNELKFTRAVEYIERTAKTRDVIVILGGDMIDAINVSDPRFNPSEICAKYSIRDLKDLPRKQMQDVYKCLKPIEHLIKFANIGNHCESYIKHNGFDIYDYLTNDLLPDCKKLGYDGFIYLSISDPNENSHICESIKISSTHGTGGGGYREGYTLNNMTDVFRYKDADLYLMGHTHKMEAREFEYLTVNKSGHITKRKKWYGNSGCFLDTYKEGTRGYFEARKGTLSDIGFLEFRIDIASHYYRKSLIAHK